MGQVGGPRRARQAEHAKDRNENMFEFLIFICAIHRLMQIKIDRIFKAFATGIFLFFDRFILARFAIVVKIYLFICVVHQYQTAFRLSE